MNPLAGLERSTAWRAIPGWLSPVDARLFNSLLLRQRLDNTRGNLLEIGAYLGKTTCLLGQYLNAGEELTVVDLFGLPPGRSDNDDECLRSYGHVPRMEFEDNCIQILGRVPKVLQIDSVGLGAVAELKARSMRFIHVDGSHLYHIASTDLQTAASLISPEGWVVVDDYRAEHTPGTALAMWESVARGLYEPMILSPGKAYLRPTTARSRGESYIELLEADGFEVVEEPFRDRPVLRVTQRGFDEGYAPPLPWRIRNVAKRLRSS